MITTLEICAGAGGQALGLEQAGFHHIALVEIEKQYCETLKQNRPQWNVICWRAGFHVRHFLWQENNWDNMMSEICFLKQFV